MPVLLLVWFSLERQGAIAWRAGTPGARLVRLGGRRAGSGLIELARQGWRRAGSGISHASVVIGPTLLERTHTHKIRTRRKFILYREN